MAVISNAIEKGYNISGRNELDNQTWEMFQEKVCGKKLFLFGLGNGATFYFKKCKQHVLEGIIDNDKAKQGIKATWFMPREAYDVCGDLCISDISILKRYHSDEVVVLITSLKNYSDICDQLESYGIYHNFALLPMEANWRKNHEYELDEETFEQYIQRCHEEKIHGNKIVFYNQNSYCGHGKYITEQLLRISNDLDIVWFAENPFLEVPKGVRLEDRKNYKKYLYEMETAKIWVSDYCIKDLTKKPGQIFVMVKHWASITLKSFALDVLKFKNETSPEVLSRYTGENIDYIIVGSEFDEKSCRSGFDYQGEVYYAGSPRSDILFDPQDIREKICEHYHIDQDCHILMYAPTYRYNPEVLGQWEARNIELDYEQVKLALEKYFGGKWCILLRLHPKTVQESFGIKKPEYVINVSEHPDSQELLAASDILVTDYSSIMFEPAFVKKPVFLFATDREEYIDGERELLIDYDTLPFPIAESNEELVQKIQDFNRQEYEESVTRFLDKYGVHEDGHASERAAEFLLELMSLETEKVL